MALSRVQRTNGNASFTTSLATAAFASTTTAGNAIVAFINTSADNSSTDVTSITDTAGNTYTRQCGAAHPNSSDNIEVWLAKNITAQASNIVTAHDSGSNLCNIIAIEIAGLPTSGTVLDQFGTATGSGGTLTATTSSATTNANDFIFVAGSITNNTGTWTLGSGYSNLENPTTSATAFAVESKIVAATGSQSGTLTESVTTQNYIALIVALSDTAIVAPLSVDVEASNTAYKISSVKIV